MRHCTSIAGVCCLWWCAVAQAAERPTFECRWSTGPIKIDGKADEDAWKNAQVIDRFYLPWLGDKARAAKTSTKARLLWDREAIYFFAELEDTDLYADVKQDDGMTWNNDVFELFFKPAVDKPGYYEFQVNAAGTRMDMFLPRRGAGGYQRFIKDGKFQFDAAVVRNGTLNKWEDKDQGWTVEGKLLWRDFLKTGGRPAVDEAWRFALCRYDYSVDFEGPELSTCAPLSPPRPDFHRHEDYADLKFVGPPEGKHARGRFGIENGGRVVTSRVRGSPEPPLPYVAVRTLDKLGLTFPIFVTHEPGGRRLWFIDQKWSSGPARICRTGPQPQDGEYDVLLDLDAVAYSLAFHPKFAQNHLLFVGSNGPMAGDDKHTRVVRYKFAGGKLQDETTIIEWPSNGHNGGAITFGNDGMLYVTSGDGTSDSDTNVMGQGLDHLLAKLLRIDVDRPDGDRPYSVPRDNPFVGQAGVRPETWAYGFRNPWRITTDPRTGHIWVGNNGQDLWEQAFLVQRGANYGWSVYEGSHLFYPNRKLGPTPVSKPTVEHSHSESRSLTGGVVYHGRKLPELQGAYIYGDHSTGKIWGVKHDGRQIVWHKELADTPLNITGFGLDGDGELLVVDHQRNRQGGFYRLQPPAELPDPGKFPRKLSETGLFASVKDHRLAAGAIAYSVNSPLWSDGAYKQRWLAMPLEMGPPEKREPSRIEVTKRRGWNFPDQTVLIKSFALEQVEGKPETRKWIETRLLTRQQGEWIGYSYRWNDEQTEAVLVDKAGADQAFTIRTAGGQRKQVWHYPSRTECMVCHSRAANYVLGPSTLQMNKQHDYGPSSANQLAVLEALGLLQIDWRSDAINALREDLKQAGKSRAEINELVKQQTATRMQREAGHSTLLAQPPSALERLVDPYDNTASLDARARSYLHANCAQCHVEAGGGNAQMELEFTTLRDKMRVIDVPPIHHKYDLPDARLVAPGHPERSVLLHRVSIRGRGQMPQLATSQVDQRAVEMLRAWILSLKEGE